MTPSASGSTPAVSQPATTTTAPDAVAPTTPAATPSAAPTTRPSLKAPPPVGNSLSLRNLMVKPYDGRNLRLGSERGSTAAYRQYYATYQGSGLTISGRINIPRGTGPFPAVVLAHGYVDPKVYTNGGTMLRERDYLARQGYITLHIDYRNHAQSSNDPSNGANLRLGYTEDAINAALALQKDPRVDPNRIGLIGRSMGGGVVYNALVVKPDLFKAAIAYAPVSSNQVENFDKWVRRDPERDGDAAAVIRTLGTPEANPAAWAQTSAGTFFDRVSDPLMIHHGTADEDCPIRWSNEAVATLKAKGKQVTYHVYPGERHTMTAQWPLSIQRSKSFLDQHMR